MAAARSRLTLPYRSSRGTTGTRSVRIVDGPALSGTQGHRDSFAQPSFGVGVGHVHARSVVTVNVNPGAQTQVATGSPRAEALGRQPGVSAPTAPCEKRRPSREDWASLGH